MPLMNDKLPQAATTTRSDSGDNAERVDSHLSTAAHTGNEPSA